MNSTRVGLSRQAIDHQQIEAVKIAQGFEDMSSLECLHDAFALRKQIAIASEKLEGDALRNATKAFNMANMQIARALGLEYLTIRI